jgi:hypothetical protein
MNPREVMMNMKQRERVHVVFNALAERICQACKPAHLHSHVEILSLNVAGADMLRIRVTENDLLSDAKTLGGAVRPRSIRISAEHLDQRA